LCGQAQAITLHLSLFRKQFQDSDYVRELHCGYVAIRQHRSLLAF
jgi:hypothetical protein